MWLLMCIIIHTIHDHNGGEFMQHNLSTPKTRLNILVPVDLKARLSQLCESEGKTVSMLVRESIEAKLADIERKLFEEKMKNAYLDLAEENLGVCRDFEFSDAENMPSDG